MTDLLTSSSLRNTAGGPAGGRSLALRSAAGGVVAAGVVLLCCMAVGLAGWFASEAGAHGDTRDAIRVGADAWLLAHGSTLVLGAGTVSVLPLGLTALCGYACFRLGRWAAVTSAVEDVRAAGTGAVCLAGAYGAVAMVTAVLASHEAAQPHLGRAFSAAFLLALLLGGAGVLRGSGLVPEPADRTPGWLGPVLAGATCAVLLMLAAGSLLVAAALLADFGSAANVLAQLHVDVPGGLLYTVVVAAVAPNATLLGAAYLVGPGFAVGTGTVVSPSAVVLGPVPAFPLLAALPDDAATPAWTSLLLGVPVLLSAVAAAIALRRFSAAPAMPYTSGALRGLLSGLLGGAAVAVLSVLAGGSVGPGRMAEVGVSFAGLAPAACVAMGGGGLLGGLVMTWWLRRRARVEVSTEGTAAR